MKFQLTFAVHPNYDKKNLSTDTFFFSLFFFFSFFFSSLFPSFYRQNWQRNVGPVIWPMCFFSKVKCGVSSFLCCRIPVSFHKVSVGREVTAKHHLWLWIFLGVSYTRFSQRLLHNICSQVRGSCCPHFTDGILRDRRNNAKCFKDI